MFNLETVLLTLILMVLVYPYVDKGHRKPVLKVIKVAIRKLLSNISAGIVPKVARVKSLMMAGLNYVQAYLRLPQD